MRNIQIGIAVVVGIAVIALFFIFNPFAVQNALNPIDTSNPINSGAAQPGALTTQDEVVGTGAAAQAGDMLTVNYTGKLQDGTVFDTSVGKAPYKFVLGAGQVIQGWDLGLVGMQVGGTRLLVVPASLAYGAQGNGPIPPNATLTFEVTLVSITPASNVAPNPEGSSI